MRLFAIWFVCLSTTLAHAKTAPKVIVVASVEGSVPSTRAVSARLGQRVDLHAVVQLGRIFYSSVSQLKIGGRKIARKRIRPLSALGSIRLSWSRVEPRPHHVTLDPPNRGNPAYSNSILFGPKHGKWLGYDRIEYTETPIRGASKPMLSLTRVTPTHTKVNVHGGLGTMRYRVIVELADGRRLASPGAPTEAPTRGISPKVMRLSFRSADDFVGYLTTYFNVPNVFGSGGFGRRHQAELYQGADCADVITAAARRAGASSMAYTSAAGLRRYAQPVSERLLLTKEGFFALGHGADGKLVKGAPLQLRFGEAVRRGDLMLIDYVGFTASPRRWDHVAVVAADRNRVGWLDPEDRVMHMGYLYGLTDTAAHTEGPAIVRFLRFKPRFLRAFARHRRALAKRLRLVRR